MNINEKLATIQTEFKSKKSRFNSFGKYYFRSAEDILEATKPFLKELGVTVVITEELLTMKPGSCDQPVLKTTATISDTETSISATAVVGVDTDQKGMQMPQRYGAASSYGKKYALGNLFLIDDTQDSDATNNHGKTNTTNFKPNGSSKKKNIKIDSDEFNKAREYLLAGGQLEKIKSKYEFDWNTENQMTMNTGK